MLSPKIVGEDTFRQAQIMLEKSKKAPARARAKEEMYLLSSKIFCGQCQFSIIGIIGTSKSGKIYGYYQCNNNRKKNVL